MQSMTGFGTAESTLGTGKIALELRALNHRFLDLRVRLPSELLDYTFFLEHLARERLTRGRFDVSVKMVGAVVNPPTFAIERASLLYKNLCDLRDRLAPGTEVPISALAAFAHLVTESSSASGEAVQAALRSAFELAYVRLNESRRQEGQVLRIELEGRISTLRTLQDSVAQRGREPAEVVRTRLRERVERILTEVGVSIDRSRLETELVLLAERADITEELVRLKCHIEQFELLLGNDGQVGRRLDFLLQEMIREANTLGAKSQDAKVSHSVVEMKAELERIREQVQNVE